MKWIARIFATAVARRLAYVAIALIAAWLGLSDAHAQAKNCLSDSAKCSVGEADAQCQAFVPPVKPGFRSNSRKQCLHVGGPNTGYTEMKYWQIRASNGVEDGPFNEGNWYWVNRCSSEPQYSGTGPWSNGGAAKNGSIGCRNGCDGAWFGNADGTKSWNATGSICPNDEEANCNAMGSGYFWNGFLKVCEPADDGKCKDGTKPNSQGQCAPEPCPQGMAQQQDGTCKKKDSECPAGMIRSPLGTCIPGDGQCAKGEVRGLDGTCKRDADNDGNPDPVNEESFSGGDDCSAPPSCSGSPIMCGQARIQWRIDCNTRRNRNIAGGACNAMPVCTGEKCDAMEYAGLVLQWRSACAAEKLAAKQDTPGQGGNQGDANGNGVADVLEGRGDVTPIGDGTADIASAKKWGIGLSTSNLDTSNMFGGGGTCPEPPPITIMGKTVNAADFPYFCRIAAIFRALILIFGAYSAIQILMGRVF